MFDAFVSDVIVLYENYNFNNVNKHKVTMDKCSIRIECCWRLLQSRQQILPAIFFFFASAVILRTMTIIAV